MQAAAQILKTVFGHDGFRPGQAEIIAAVSAGENVLAVMPTGGGKSLCYQVPALMADRLAVVISPLIALMRDQVAALSAAGVAAGSLTSGNTEAENAATLAALRDGSLRLLYIAPERLGTTAMQGALRAARPAFIAVDEAHCVSQWGHDFRPDYLRIGPLRRALGVPLAAFTATADEATRADIVARLFDGAAPRTFIEGFDRPNIRLAFAAKNGPRRQILDFAGGRRGQAGIVYCATRAKTETLAAALREAGHEALAYHAGMEAADRRAVEERFRLGDGVVVVATVAFGMGIDKPDIRWVAHADLPASVEAYYQEIGRAGRDGLPADTLTLYGPDDIRLRRAQIDEGLAPPEQRAADHARLNTLLGIAEATGCRRQKLLAVFGETPAPCGNCDTCATPPETFDGTEAVRMALSAILRTGESFGAQHLIDILTGHLTDRVRARGHDRLPTFGVGQGRSAADWRAIFTQMMGLDLIRPDAARHGALRVMEAARPVLRGETTLALRRPAPAARAPRPARALVADEDQPLLAALKARRRAFAEAARVPAYVIFPDRTLIEMAEKRPGTLDEMMAIGGVGAKKLERYGQAFLEVITGAEAPLPHPARRRLAGRSAGPIFDRLTEAGARLVRGELGTERPLSVPPALLARLAEQRPTDASGVARILGPRRAERFGPAFLEILTDG